MSDENDFSQYQADVIIIGTGMGGATLGYLLAKAGKKVLFCEKGRSSLSLEDALTGNYAEELYKTEQSSQADVLLRSGRCYEQIEDRTEKRVKSFYPFAGCGTGGSGALYGMVMQRFWPEDFHPGASFADADHANIPDSWPINYADLQPFYQQIEALYRVKGELDPLRSDNLDSIPERNPCSEDDFSYVLSEHLRKQGLHPYQPPLACELKEDCQHCQGYLCAKDCKNDCLNRCLKPAVEQHGAKLIASCRVVKLLADQNKVTGVVCEKNGKTFILESDIVVLAAGALETPNILLNSKNETWPNGLCNSSGMVGRNLMRNFYDLYFIFPKNKKQLIDGPKDIYLTDFYHSKASKLGIVQSFGHLSAQATVEGLENDIQNSFLAFTLPLFKIVKPIVAKLFDKLLIQKSYILVSTMEDMPYYDNRVIPSSETGGAIAIHYKVNDYDQSRIKKLRTLINNSLKGFRLFVLNSAEDNKNFIALTCGTCRFGDNRNTSVLDKNNKTHDLGNLYIVDSSFFPTNPGLNSGLTVAANAARIASYFIENDIVK